MAKLRKKYKERYTVILNTVIEDKRLSYKAVGLFVDLWHSPDDWEYYLSEIVNRHSDGKDSVKSGLLELEKLGYLRKSNKHRNENGTFDSYDWDFSETAEFNQSGLSAADNHRVGKTAAGNPPLQNKYLPSTKNKQSTNVTNLSRSSATSNKKKEKSKTKLQSSYDDWTAKTNQQLTDLAMHYTKTRVANEQNELAYFNTLMEDWQSRNFETVTEVKNYLSNKNGNYSKQPKSNVIQPEWLSDDYVEPEPPKVTEEDRKQVKEMLKKFD